jgi:RHS repeat-associated protein
VGHSNAWTAGYNGDGLRVWKQTASGRRYYLYDGEELVCELNEAGNAVHLLNDNGYATSHLVYDAWGQLMSGSNPTPYGYKGQWGYYTDTETGFLLLTHRYLDPAVGRFWTRDPIGLEGGANLYAYVGNGVVVRTDASGLWFFPSRLVFDTTRCLVCAAQGFQKGDEVLRRTGKDKLAYLCGNL